MAGMSRPFACHPNLIADENSGVADLDRDAASRHVGESRRLNQSPSLSEEAVKAVEQDGAEAIIFGCTGLLGCADAVRQGLLPRGIDVPVIDPIPTAVSVAAAIARVGLAPSKLTYPMPPQQLIGYPAVRPPAAIAAE